MAENKRVHVIIGGRVQGVFFRMETQRAAESYQINGWVKNRPDGRVEAVFEGDSDQVGRMIQWCWKGSPMSRVDGVDITEEAYTGDFSDFKITY